MFLVLCWKCVILSSDTCREQYSYMFLSCEHIQFENVKQIWYSPLENIGIHILSLWYLTKEYILTAIVCETNSQLYLMAL